MNNRLDDVLAAIDAETAKCICGNTIPADGASLDYCSDVCQYGYTAEQAGAEIEDEYTFHINHGPTDGRTINEEVNAWFERTSGRRPGERTVTVSVAIDLAPITEAARQLRETLPQALAAAARSTADAVEELAQTMAQEDPQDQGDSCNPCQGHVLSTQATNRNGTRVMWVPNIADPNAPTAGELAAGITLGVLDQNGHLQSEAPAVLEPSRPPAGSPATLPTRANRARGLTALEAAFPGWRESIRQWENEISERALELRTIVPDADRRAAYLMLAQGNARRAIAMAHTGATPEQLLRLRSAGVPADRLPEVAQFEPQRALEIVQAMEHFAEQGIRLSASTLDSMMRPTPEHPVGEEFRRRALAARQNRGTGPARRDNRRWRNR